jgi:hypothetical protein
MRADATQEMQAAQAAEAARAAREAQVEAELARVRAEMARAQAEQARAAGEIAAAQARGELRDVRVERGPDGHTTVHLPGGRVVTIDKSLGAVTSPDALLHEAGVSVPPVPPRDSAPDFFRLGVAGAVLCALLAIVWTVARATGRRAAAAPPAPDLDARLQRIEQAVESIAVEVERVSEAQRFSARLLAERGPSDAAAVRVAGRSTPAAGTPLS